MGLALASIMGAARPAGTTPSGMPKVVSDALSARSRRCRSAVASASRPARVRRVASRIMFGFSMSFMSKASLDGDNRPRHQKPDPSLHPVGQSLFDGRTGVQGSQHDDRRDGGASKL